MTDGLKASQIKGGIRPSKSFDQGRVCKDESCSTQLSIYNKRDHCFNHAPVKYPRVRGRILQETALVLTIPPYRNLPQEVSYKPLN